LVNYQLELFSSQQLQQFPDLVTVLNWPPGYVYYLRKNLAVDMAPQAAIASKLGKLSPPEQTMLQLVIRQAREAKLNLESYNAEHPVLSMDPAFGGRGALWNYAVGEVVTRGN
jgi:hypothetical protein